MSFELRRPDHLDEASWDAVQSYRARFETASRLNDRPGVVGAAKDLIECIARTVLLATGVTLGDNAKFNSLIYEAQKALKRQAGYDIGQSEEVRAVANAAQVIATSVSPLRNQVGSGHGRSRLADIDEEMVEIVSDATMLWCRWALRRLGHLLAGYPTLLVKELHESSNRVSLLKHFEAVCLPDQPPDIQHFLGVEFGQAGAGGYGNAMVVGVLPAAADGTVDDYPVEYRLGLVEGMLLTGGGQIGLTASYVPTFISILEPLPPTVAATKVIDLAVRAESATWITRLRWSGVQPRDTLDALNSEKVRLSTQMQEALDALCAALDPDKTEG
jgi:Abortive infection C-terminus